jgi:DNA-binding NtrC family response regulator
MSEQKALILIVEDDPSMIQLLSRLMKVEGLRTLEARDGKTALRLLSSDPPDLMLLNLRAQEVDGLEVLRQARKLNQKLPVIALTTQHDIDEAVRMTKAGAFEYLAKPFDGNDLIRAVHQALPEGVLKRKVDEPSGNLRQTSSLTEMMGPSDAVKRIMSEGPFIAVDCGAIPETLLESELFGHEKGAFTGADGQKRGKLEMAEGGTIFLDEISNMPLGSQAKLLRVLQEKKIYRLGGTKPISINVRLLVASNRDLHELSEEGSFRKDLFYRLNEFSIIVPPLRERKEDIPYLAKRFLDKANLEIKKSVKGFSDAALHRLFHYSWPGNVRQLRSIIRRATLLAEDIIDEIHLDLKKVPVPGLAFTPKVEGTLWKGLSLKEITEESVMAVEREVLAQVMNQVAGNKAKAARLLKIDYKTIHLKLKKLGLCKEFDDDGEGQKKNRGIEKTAKKAMKENMMELSKNPNGVYMPEGNVFRI